MTTSTSNPRGRPKLVDFFSGCGGTSAGFRAAGFDVVAGIDNDWASGQTFRRNFPTAKVFGRSIVGLLPEDLSSAVAIEAETPLVFAISAPCQPFSKQRRGHHKGDERASLLMQTRKFIEYFKPMYLFIENVPGIKSSKIHDSPLEELWAAIKGDYSYQSAVVSSASYGVPQRRTRLVALASRVKPIDLPRPTHGAGPGMLSQTTVKEWIGDLPPLEAGQEDKSVSNHRAAGLSVLNLARIRATPEGGSMADWPPHLLPPCHANGYTGHSDVYGRMSWDALATGLTTRCISYSNGRFGHPDVQQHRAISVREAASLQTFRRDFIFDGSWEDMGRQIGNAVPVKMAHAFAAHVLAHMGLPAEEYIA